MSKVTVTVDAKGIISCAPDPVPVTGKIPALVFGLATQGYAFAAAGAIVVKKPSPDFPEPSKTVSATEATLVDLNKIKAEYAYSVSLVDTRTGDKIEIDPTIVNDGSGG